LQNLIGIAKYLITIITAIIFFSSCLKDPCTGVFCSEKGECINGTCLCEDKYIGEACENNYASYFAGNYIAFNELNDSLNDTIRITVYNSTDSISINNYAGLSNNINVLAVVLNDSVISIFNQMETYLVRDASLFFRVEKLKISGIWYGKPTDTIQLISSYRNNNGIQLYNKKLLKITN